VFERRQWPAKEMAVMAVTAAPAARTLAQDEAAASSKITSVEDAPQEAKACAQGIAILRRLLVVFGCHSSSLLADAVRYNLLHRL
jgi:hypothetical protein